MEWWKNGIVNIADQKRMMVWFYFLFSAIFRKIDLIPQTQYSNIPVFQYPMAFIYGKAYYLWPGPEDQIFNVRIKQLQI